MLAKRGVIAGMNLIGDAQPGELGIASSFRTGLVAERANSLPLAHLVSSPLFPHSIPFFLRPLPLSASWRHTPVVPSYLALSLLPASDYAERVTLVRC